MLLCIEWQLSGVFGAGKGEQKRMKRRRKNDNESRGAYAREIERHLCNSQRLLVVEVEPEFEAVLDEVKPDSS